MKVLNNVALAISGLTFAGATALTTVAVIPASAQAATSTPYMVLQSGGEEEEQNNDATQSNECRSGEGSVNCANTAEQATGENNDIDQDADTEQGGGDD